MGSLTMDELIIRFVELLHYVSDIKDEKVKIQQFSGFLPTYFKDRIEFYSPNTLEEALYKETLYYGKNKHMTKNLNKKK